ncbi:hypothetical protein BMS3Bbin10_02210 [bacterium BMS3Bbin10]|nr:hypothetical protein BMS3Bbin10_02210 [bacterium BMS3Bbin10]
MSVALEWTSYKLTGLAGREREMDLCPVIHRVPGEVLRQGKC